MGFEDEVEQSFGRPCRQCDSRSKRKYELSSSIVLRAGNGHSADGWDDVLKAVVARYQGKVSRIYFRADAAFAMPEVYEFLEAERIKYAVRLPANQVLQGRIGYLLTRPVGRPPHHVRRFHANFSYQAGTWTKSNRQKECVQMPGKMARSAPRPSVRVTRSAGSGQHLASLLQEGRENALMPVWDSSGESRIIQIPGDGLCKMFMKRRRGVSGGHFAFGG
jgi:hypothetical protein